MTTTTEKIEKTEKTTTKRMKIVGTQQYVNTTTGEVENFQVISIEDRDANFEKLWLGHILHAIGELGNAKMQVLMYLLSKRTRDNVVLKTLDEIVQESKISKKTVHQSLKILEKYDIIRRKTGVIFINPDIIYRGGKNSRMKLVIEYSKIENGSEGDEDTCR